MLGEEYYDSSGNPVVETHAEAIEQLFGYTGRPLDESTGLQNNLHRWYDSAAGRWVSEDPIGFAAGDANLARYVGNGATIAVDPSGLHYIVDPEDLEAEEERWAALHQPLPPPPPPRPQNLGPSVRACSPEEGRARYFDYLAGKQQTQLLSDREYEDFGQLSLQLRLDQRARNQQGIGFGGRMLDFFNPGYAGLGTFDDAMMTIAGFGPGVIGLSPAAPPPVMQGRIDGHHPIPKFLGGYPGQRPLTPLDSTIHTELHCLLRGNLRNAGIPLNVGGRGGSSLDWARYMRNNPGTQRREFDAMLDASRGIDVKHGTNVTQDVWRSIIDGAYRPYP